MMEVLKQFQKKNNNFLKVFFLFSLIFFCTLQISLAEVFSSFLELVVYLDMCICIFTPGASVGRGPARALGLFQRCCGTCPSTTGIGRDLGEGCGFR